MRDLNWAIEHLPSLGLQNMHTEDMDFEQLEGLRRGLQEACDCAL